MTDPKPPFVGKPARRAAYRALANGALLAFAAWRADGHYDQERLWSIGLFGAGLVAWLTAYAVALTRQWEAESD